MLREIGERLELAGDSPYKSRAYYKAADSLLALPRPLSEVIERGELRSIPGVGEVIEEKIRTLWRTGTHPTLERLRAEYPAGLLELLQIPKLKPDKIGALNRELDVTDLDSLEEACRTGRVAEAKGFGPALQARILEGIEFARSSEGLTLIHHAHARAQAACERLRSERPDLDRIEPAGEVRRGCELVGDIVIVGGSRSSVVSRQSSVVPGCPETADCILTTDDRFGLALLYATGSATHVRALEELAASRGIQLSADGLRKDGRDLPAAEEADVYGALGLSCITPELREGRGEVERALSGTLPGLVELPDIRGILHCHTDASDGTHTLEEMAEATRSRGYQYFGLADHSRSAFYAGGLQPDRLAAQLELADRLNARYEGEDVPFRVFKGTESDIRPDGSLDYPDDLLARLDFVVASVHGQFRLPKTEQTQRILKAVANRRTTILGHMTGRLLLERKGYEVDIEAVLRACAAYGVAVEINANPHRLDLDWRWHQRALELGCTFSINPDAHSTGELDLVRWGVLMARKGGIPPDRILNCLDLEGITRHLAVKRGGGA